MALVLAIEPDHRQATILKRVMREQVRADLVLVDSRDAAISAIAAKIPDVILVTALLSPRDEEELVAYLRSLEAADHLQTYTIPQLASTPADGEIPSTSGGGLFGKFRRRKDPEPAIAGCDPTLFAEEIKTFLDRAVDRKSQGVIRQSRMAGLGSQKGNGAHATQGAQFVRSEWQDDVAQNAAPESAAEQGPKNTAFTSAWASPFEWRPTDAAQPAPQHFEAPAAAEPAPFEAPPPAPPPAAADEPGEPPVQEPPSSMVANVPLAVAAAEQEARALDKEAELARLALEAEERLRIQRERQQIEEEERERRAAEERQRFQAEVAARRAREEEERRRHEAEERIRQEAEAARRREEEGRRRLEAEARRKREEEERLRRAELERLRREELERRRREEEERRRIEAEARRKREEEERKRREEIERRRREEEERKRLEAEARRKREEEERKRRDEETRRRREEEERKRLEEARRRREEEERKRLEAEARRKREEEERKRREEEARRRKEEEERRRLEAEARRRQEEEERRHREEEDRRRREDEERKRLDAEARRKREEEDRRQPEEEEARRKQDEEEEAPQRQREEAERRRREERVPEEAEVRRREEAGRTRREREQEQTPEGIAASADGDAFAEFRAEHDEPKGVLRLFPVDTWARYEKRAQTDGDGPQDELSQLISRLTIPPQVAGITYPRGCRIRRVRVRALERPKGDGTRQKPVIVSRKALQQTRTRDRGARR